MEDQHEEQRMKETRPVELINLVSSIMEIKKSFFSEMISHFDGQVGFNKERRTIKNTVKEKKEWEFLPRFSYLSYIQCIP